MPFSIINAKIYLYFLEKRNKMKEKITKVKNLGVKNLKWIILFILLIMILAIVEDVFEKEIMKLDIIGYGLISSIINPSVTPIAIVITNLGGVIVICTLTIILFLLIKNKKISFCILLNLIIATVLNLLLKNIIQRPRPDEFRLILETGYSFPSGHSMISMAFYGFLIYLSIKYLKNKKLKVILTTFLSILIILIGISRIYLGVHYTSDVIAGFMISVCYLIIYTTFAKKYIIEREDVNENKNEKINK